MDHDKPNEYFHFLVDLSKMDILKADSESPKGERQFQDFMRNQIQAARNGAPQASSEVKLAEVIKPLGFQPLDGSVHVYEIPPGHAEAAFNMYRIDRLFDEDHGLMASGLARALSNARDYLMPRKTGPRAPLKLTESLYERFGKASVDLANFNAIHIGFANVTAKPVTIRYEWAFVTDIKDAPQAHVDRFVRGCPKGVGRGSHEPVDAAVFPIAENLIG